MTPEFNYRVVSTNVDGYKAASRFTNARDAFAWTKRLKDEGFTWSIYKTLSTGEAEITIADLKKEATACPTSRRKTAPSSRKPSKS